MIHHLFADNQTEPFSCTESPKSVHYVLSSLHKLISKPTLQAITSDSKSVDILPEMAMSSDQSN